ncbi:ATP synthase F1 subcomplex epsilon subunit [Palleronia marisminoris]|uniref:ATP synthase epsilon chain n=1 Tax=Palleronia marisminoris TaxID=315423 RepID=A0A1Y5RWE2_9RHOB|nr:F0F1 ATP synthase subunit epsilon [Palleronia marisminoris]SFG43650.1 ATP synthase F1 subcomplex epsilon subunit [Palleronia marisminoris]SLN27049.1 ATP synthase epsilon chain [Palleronia marisminoris]
MADMMQFDLVSPERRIASYKASAVKLPGAEGDLTAMANHAPLITTLRPGVLHVEGEQGTDEYVVTGGFAQITPEGISVLAEESYHRDEMSQEILDRMIDEVAEKQRKSIEASHNQPGPTDDAAKLLSDMMAMGSHIGLSPKQPNL